jgi:hypothetical protein
MLYVVSKKNGIVREKQWHLGEKILVIPEDIIEIQADGHELEYVLANVKGLIHNPEDRVVNWYDLEAVMIAKSLIDNNKN